MNSKELAYILRHHPEEYGLSLDDEGWCSTEELLKALDIEMEELDNIVLNNTRFIYNSDKQFIKAAHGHNKKLNINYYKRNDYPPKLLYHGTTEEAYNKMKIYGNCIDKMSRSAVHLSEDEYEAFNIAKRHKGKTIILVIDAQELSKKYPLHKSEDGVWLVEKVPLEYTSVVEIEKR